MATRLLEPGQERASSSTMCAAGCKTAPQHAASSTAPFADHAHACVCFVFALPPRAHTGTQRRSQVGGNGGGDGCCQGTTSYFPLTQSAPGMPFEEPKDGPGQGMLDWGSFILKMPINPPTAAVSPSSLPSGWQVVEAVNNVSSCGP